MGSSNFYRFVQIIERLRKECPWDSTQSHQSLIPYLLEEAYELIETIENTDFPSMKEELGDLLLQVVLHSVIAAEKADFTIEDVIDGISEKMIKRHPHVFENKSGIKTSEDVMKNWEKIKNKKHILSGVPNNLPALLKAYRIGEKCKGIGFDWNTAEEAFLKVEEELQEVIQAKKSGSKADLDEEIGDLLFAISSYARLSGIEPESSLRKALLKFQGRFEKIEENLKKCENLQEMEDLWQRSK